jgi:hypothetical protein
VRFYCLHPLQHKIELLLTNGYVGTPIWERCRKLSLYLPANGNFLVKVERNAPKRGMFGVHVKTGHKSQAI